METKKKRSDDRVRGMIKPATADGFAELLRDANEFLARKDGLDYRMLTIVRLEKAVAAVFVRVNEKKGITEFFEDDGDIG